MRTYSTDTLRDAVALLILAVDGDVKAGRELLGRVLTERPPDELATALVSLGSAMAYRLAQLAVVAHNCTEDDLKAGAAELTDDELRTVALDGLQALGADLAHLLTNGE